MDFFLSRKLSGRHTLSLHTVFTVLSATLAATRTSCPPGEFSRSAQSQKQSKDKPAGSHSHSAGRAGQAGWEGESLLEQTRVAATACSSGARLSPNFGLPNNYVGSYFTALWGMASRIPFTERR